MTRAIRATILGVLVLACLASGYRIIAHTMADSLAGSDPERALQWIPHHPSALLTLAERQLLANDDRAAANTARELIRSSPLEGRALRILGAVADRAGDDEQARRLYEHAVILSPRDGRTRTWLIRRYVTAGDYAKAVLQMDQLLRVAPRHRTTVVPLMAELAQLPAFVEVLVPVLATDPPWRGHFLKELHGGAYPLGAQRVASALAQSGGLAPEEHHLRIESLIKQNEWGKAYAYWVSGLPQAARVPLVYNGDFAQTPSNQGFDWRVRHVPGVQVRFVPQQDGRALMAQLSFRRRPIREAGLEQPLLLAEGVYRMSLRVRADGLQTQSGLEWVVQCASGPVAGRSGALDGSFLWRTETFHIEIPSNCPGQWLKLRNRVSSGSGQLTVGEVWVDDVSITPGVGQ